MAFGRIPSLVCDEAVSVQEGWEDFLLTASIAGASEGMKRVAEALTSHGDWLQGGDSCPSSVSPCVFYFCLRCTPWWFVIFIHYEIITSYHPPPYKTIVPRQIGYGWVGRICLLWELDFLDKTKFMQLELLRQEVTQKGAVLLAGPIGLPACSVQE